MMRKRLCLTVLGLLLGLILGTAASRAEEVIFNAHWLKSELQTYDIQQTRYTLRQGDTVHLEIYRFRAEAVVLDSTAKGYRVHWRLYQPEAQIKHYLSLQWMGSLGPVHFYINTSAQGVLRSVENGESLSLDLDSSIDRFFASCISTPPLAQREMLYATREHVEAFLRSFVEMFHATYGLGYTLREVVKVPESNGVTLKRLESYQDGIGVLVTNTLTTPDTGELSSAMAMHIPTGWPVYAYRLEETASASSAAGAASSADESASAVGGVSGNVPGNVSGVLTEIRLAEPEPETEKPNPSIDR